MANIPPSERPKAKPSRKIDGKGAKKSQLQAALQQHSQQLAQLQQLQQLNQQLQHQVQTRLNRSHPVPQPRKCNSVLHSSHNFRLFCFLLVISILPTLCSDFSVLTSTHFTGPAAAAVEAAEPGDPRCSAAECCGQPTTACRPAEECDPATGMLQ